MNLAEENKQDQTEGSGTPKKKKGRRFAVFLISGMLAVLLLIYGGIAIFYQSHFLPHTQINQFDCGNLDVMEAARLFESQAQGYTLEVTGRDWKRVSQEEEVSKAVLGVLGAQDLHLSLKGAEKSIQGLLDQQNPLLWIQIFLGKSQSFQLSLYYEYDEAVLEKTVRKWEAFQTKNMTKPENASISEYTDGGYSILPETKGTLLDIPGAIEAIREMVYEGTQKADLDEMGCYKTASVTADDPKLLESWAMMNKWVQTRITYDWNGQEIVVDGEKIHEWISREDTSSQIGQPVLDEEAVAAFVAETARQCDTYGKKRKFTTFLGEELTLPSGAYGWRTDRKEETEELIQLIYQGSVVEKEPVYITRAANKGKNDIGSSYVEIDLSNQHLYLFQEGEVVLETDFVSGNMSKEGYMTPPGVFGLTYKTRNAVLRGENYETPVNYWMPFNGNVGMHDSTWRRSYGGDIYLTSGSHGCINLPLDMAKQIYEYVSTGFPVICYYY